ncbi:MAG: 16S rRNA (cytidine(1402)-2'-O)-methyltransferase, partial [bacterium]
LTSYHEHNKQLKGQYLIEQLKTGKNIAVVTDAGMPGISDPGYDLVTLAVEAGIKVVPLPGAVAAVSALVVSGLPTEQFVFLGFLPRAGKKRKNELLRLAVEERTMIFYEAPHRLRKTLEDLLHALGNRQIVIGRELTKKYEEFWRGELMAALDYFQEPKGEITIVLAGNENSQPEEFFSGSVEEEMELLLSQGMEKMECFKKIAKRRKMSKSEVYSIYLQNKKADVD